MISIFSFCYGFVELLDQQEFIYLILSFIVVCPKWPLKCNLFKACARNQKLLKLAQYSSISIACKNSWTDMRGVIYVHTETQLLGFNFFS